MNPISDNSASLIDALEGLDILNDRFVDIKCVNIDVNTGQKRGCFSLVFKARDILEDKDVALKFFDITPENLSLAYRREGFRREHQILQILLNKERCLQLTSSLNTYKLKIPLPTGRNLEIPCEYFAIDWLDIQIDEFFDNQENHRTLDKLQLFREILLAVDVLHANEIFHRDLKADNLRAYRKALKTLIVAIDFGTAAHTQSTPIDEYTYHVGAKAYAPPEAIAGLVGIRSIGKYCDIYALGCLLYEMFNHSFYYTSFRNANPKLDAMVASICSIFPASSTPENKLGIWKINAKTHMSGLTIPSISGHGSSVPAGISTLLNDCLVSLVEPIFMNRGKLNVALRKINSAIRCLENEYACLLAPVKEKPFDVSKT